MAGLVSQPGSRGSVWAAPLPADGIAEVALGLTDGEQRAWTGMEKCRGLLCIEKGIDTTARNRAGLGINSLKPFCILPFD